ncbi:MAG: glycosyltransferase family 2 protein [Candidatus Krumholzibacteria bacterium]|nr:glycosyltransferase family 2 protein [Candidatus Krumholzibacteria bacterium]
MFERFAAIVPAYNAAPFLEPVLGAISRHIPAPNIVVVDDASTDDTAIVAQRCGARVVRHEANRGKGAAIRTAQRIVGSLAGIDAVVMLDADGQHDPAEIPRFADEFMKGKADLIIGNRMAAAGEMPAIRVFTNRLTSAIVSLRAGQRIPDSQNGYRLIRASLLSRLRLVTSRYEIDSEIIIKACHAGGRAASIPVRTIYGSEKSAIHPLRDTFRFIALVTRSLFW